MVYLALLDAKWAGLQVAAALLLEVALLLLVVAVLLLELLQELLLGVALLLLVVVPQCSQTLPRPSVLLAEAKESALLLLGEGLPESSFPVNPRGPAWRTPSPSGRNVS